MEGYIHSTESFGTVDGPGIRFVVFTQGCPMRCLYCHNPDTWPIGKGTKRSVASILEEYDGVKEFLQHGGLTVTGGEPLVQLEFVTELFEAAKKKGIHTCLDTSGITYHPSKQAAFDRLMAVTDLVMLDIKHIDPEEHKKIDRAEQSVYSGVCRIFEGTKRSGLDSACCGAGYYVKGTLSAAAGLFYRWIDEFEGFGCIAVSHHGGSQIRKPGN